MTKFYVPARYNKETAETGQWFQIEDAGVYGGKYKLKFMDSYNPRIAKQIIECNDKLDATLNDTERGMKIVCELFIVDWELPVDPNAPKTAKPIQFSIKNAKEFFALEDTAWILAKIYNIVTDASKFQNPLNSEEIEKN